MENTMLNLCIEVTLRYHTYKTRCSFLYQHGGNLQVT